MADGDLYETDILAWSEQQAAALRELASRRDLPNALDLTHVAEEIEDVGLSDLHGVKSRIRLIFEQVLECYADPDALSVRNWHREIANWRIELRDRFAPSMRQRIELDAIWNEAVALAMLDVEAAGRPAARLALDGLAMVPCPLSLDALLDKATPADLVDRLRAALSG